jgi:hypothetical protein
MAWGHLTELARMLTEAGTSPDDIDFLFYQASAYDITNTAPTISLRIDLCGAVLNRQDQLPKQPTNFATT